MLGRLLRTCFLTIFLLLALAFVAGAFLPINFGPDPAGYPDLSVSTFFVKSDNHAFEVYFLTHPLTPRSTGEHWG